MVDKITFGAKLSLDMRSIITANTMRDINTFETAVCPFVFFWTADLEKDPEKLLILGIKTYFFKILNIY